MNWIIGGGGARGVSKEGSTNVILASSFLHVGDLFQMNHGTGYWLEATEDPSSGLLCWMKLTSNRDRGSIWMWQAVKDKDGKEIPFGAHLQEGYTGQIFSVTLNRLLSKKEGGGRYQIGGMPLDLGDGISLYSFDHDAELTFSGDNRFTLHRTQLASASDDYQLQKAKETLTTVETKIGDYKLKLAESSKADVEVKAAAIAEEEGSVKLILGLAVGGLIAYALFHGK